MCAALGIQIIPASSPQAKGRVERNHGTHQDRLVKKLRRQGIADVAAANAFLETDVLGRPQSALCAAARRRPTTFTSRSRAACSSTRCFGSRRHARSSNDWVVRYDNRLLQLERQSRRPPARSTVRVFEDVDGQLEIRYRGRVMRWTELAAAAAAKPAPTLATPPVRRTDGGLAAAASAMRRSSLAARGRRVPDRISNSPRIEGVGGGESVRRPVEAAGAVDAKSTRPPLLGKLQNSFPQLPQASLSTRGHF